MSLQITLIIQCTCRRESSSSVSYPQVAGGLQNAQQAPTVSSLPAETLEIIRDVYISIEELCTVVWVKQ